MAYLSILRSLLILLAAFTGVLLVTYLLSTQNVILNRIPKHHNPHFVVQMNCNKSKTKSTRQQLKKNTFKGGIPKIVHYTYSSTNVPDEYWKLMKGCMDLNKDMTFMFWTDDVALSVIRRYLPHKAANLLTFYSPKSEKLKRSDIMRNFIIYLFGGVYMDMDTRCQRPFNEVMNNFSCVWSTDVDEKVQIMRNREFLLMNSLMACVPFHNFSEILVEGQQNETFQWVLQETGPFKITDVYLKYNKTLTVEDRFNPLKSLHVAPAELFSPLMDVDLTGVCRSVVGVWQKKGCSNLQIYLEKHDAQIKKAVAVHLFSHLGYSGAHIRINKWNDVCYLQPFVYDI